MGQTPPGNTPELFLPGIVSTAHQDICLAPSPTGNEVIVTQTDVAWFPFLALIECPDGKTLQTEIPSFSGSEPVDGRRIWYVDRTSSGWGDPVFVGEQVHEYSYQACPTVTEQGTRYFHAWIEENGERVNADIFRCQLVNGPGNGSQDIYWADGSVVFSSGRD